MVTIIKYGTKYKKTCDNCGCLFSYEDEDIDAHYEWLVPIKETIECPQCRNDILLRTFDNEEEEVEES